MIISHLNIHFRGNGSCNQSRTSRYLISTPRLLFLRVDCNDFLVGACATLSPLVAFLYLPHEILIIHCILWIQPHQLLTRACSLLRGTSLFLHLQFGWGSFCKTNRGNHGWGREVQIDQSLYTSEHCLSEKPKWMANYLIKDEKPNY